MLHRCLMHYTALADHAHKMSNVCPIYLSQAPSAGRQQPAGAAGAWSAGGGTHQPNQPARQRQTQTAQVVE